MVRSAASPRVSNHEATAPDGNYRALTTFGIFTTRALSPSSA
jgi:hypothetical protein